MSIGSSSCKSQNVTGTGGNNHPGEQERRKRQSEFLRRALKDRKLGVTQIARLSRTLAAEAGHPRAGFSHEAMSAWLSGTRNPRQDNRHLLAAILQVPIEDLNRACDEFPNLDPSAILRTVRVHVYRDDRSFSYEVTVKKSLALAEPTIYKRWTDLFHPEPSLLMTHFHRVQHDCFGWIPDVTVRPLVLYPQTLVPLCTRELRLDPATSLHKRIWFVYTPGGMLQVGLAFQHARMLVLAKGMGQQAVLEKYPLGRVDLVGYAIEGPLFHLT